MIRQLRPHQERAIALLRHSLGSGRRRPLLQAPTGAGKTLLAAAIVEGALSKGNRVIFVVPALSLVDQTVEAFEAEGLRAFDIGVMQADHPRTNPACPVQVASVQTLQRRRIPESDVVVIDEAHRLFELYGRWMGDPAWARTPFIGLSATPWTRGLGRYYDDLLVAATTAELIEAGYLAPFRVFAPSHPDLSEVRTVAGDYHEGDLGEAMNRPPLVADLVETWLRRGEQRSTLCFAVDRAHAKHLQVKFEEAGVPTGYVDAYTEPGERALIRDRFHAGELRVVCNVGCLTTGVDWDVRCIILARPTKSEMLFCQIIGRGLRTADGKQDCLLRGTRILTDKGEVNIEDVTLDHKVWDGVNFVAHAGAVCKGVQPVITHDGVTATPDHRVMTHEGWKSLAEAHRWGLRIARTGVGGKPVRFPENRVGSGRGIELRSSRRGGVRALWPAAHGALSQHAEAAGYSSVPTLQWQEAGNGPEVALSALSAAAGSLHQSVIYFLRALRRPWDRVPLCRAERGGDLDCREPWDRGSLHGDRSYQERGTLRAGQSPLGSSSEEYRQQSEVPWWQRALHCLSAGASRGALCGSDLDAPHPGRADGRADHREVEHSLGKTEGEVWDILNAGPLQRFTANGRLVHNCLILDHSDTHLRLGFVTDIHHDSLDDGCERQAKSREHKVPLPKECPKCAYLKPAKVRVCPACGFKPEPVSTIECQDGDLVEMMPGRRSRVDHDEKQRWYSMLRGVAQERGYKAGWAANQYRQKFGVWPRGLSDHLMEPAPEVRSYVRSRMIAWAKSQGGAGGHGIAAE